MHPGLGPVQVGAALLNIMRLARNSLASGRTDDARRYLDRVLWHAGLLELQAPVEGDAQPAPFDRGRR